MKIKKILLACTLFATVSFAGDSMSESMTTMEKGLSKIQKGFLNNNLEIIKEGSILVKKGNEMFSKKEVIEKYLPENKKHLVNVAAASSQRISLNIKELELNLEEKAFLKAAASYSDMINACSRCHAIVRNW